MVVAVCALVLGIVGSAVAGTDGLNTKVTTAKVKRIAKKQANKVLNQKAAGLSVAKAVNADNATNATNATNAANAAALGGVGAAGYLKTGDVRADGFASSTDIDDFTTPTFTAIAEKAFTAPVNGFAYVTASLSAEDDNSFAGTGDIFFRLQLDATPVTDDVFYHELATDGASVVGATGAVTDVVPVTAGAHTLALTAREVGTGSFIVGRDISVLFVPTGSGSAIPHAVGRAGGGDDPQG
jgi:hypothetical protein